MLIGKNLGFRAIEKSDLKMIVDWRNMKDVYSFFYEYEPLSLPMQERWFEKYLNNISNEKVFIVKEISSGNDIGCVGFYNIDNRSRKCEWGRLFLVGDHRGKGYGKEIEKMSYRYVFDHLNMNKLSCEVFESNKKVIEMHLSFGSEIEGVLKSHIYKDGAYIDVVRMAILKDKYLELKKSGVYDII
jgi:UDP-4-amino-4,6-dideoxy-N-acetyl-beta-L-altrosamine N-acetyltransferase